MATKRIRGSAHQRIRDRIMSRDCGICCCATCQRTGALSLAHEVEHRIPLWAGGQEDDSNRYAIARDCHKVKTRCEDRMRAAGGWLQTACICGQHEG
jgi:5-methylcytosine-specific restriction enzyme A